MNMYLYQGKYYEHLDALWNAAMGEKIKIQVSLWEGCLQPIVVTGLKENQYDLEIIEKDSLADHGDEYIHLINGVRQK